MKCFCILWFALVYTSGSLSFGIISINRKAKLPTPGSSPDEFVVLNSKCSNGTNGGQCEKFGAVRVIGNKAKHNTDNQQCLCVCERGRETLVFRDRSWKCLYNHVLRARTGSGLLFRNENASSGLFTFGVGQWTYFANLATSFGNCDIRSSMSSYLECNGSWSPLPSKQALFLVIQDANTHFRFQVNNVNGLSGRVIKLVISCPLSPGNHSVAFKLEGSLKCPEGQHDITSTSSPLSTEPNQLFPSAVQETKTESKISQTPIISRLSYSTRSTQKVHKTVVVSEKTTSHHKTLHAVLSSAVPVLNSKGFGNRTLVHTYGEATKDRKGGISIAVLATTVATAFLFGMLLISILMLRKRRFEEQRTRTQDNSLTGITQNATESDIQLSQEQGIISSTISTAIDEEGVENDITMSTEEPVYAQVGNHFKDRAAADSQIYNAENLISNTTRRSSYDYIWPNANCSSNHQNQMPEDGKISKSYTTGSSTYQGLTSEDEKISESGDYINVTPKMAMAMGDCDNHVLTWQERPLENLNRNCVDKKKGKTPCVTTRKTQQNIGDKQNCKHVVPQRKTNENTDCPSCGDNGCPFCSYKYNVSCHTYDTRNSIIRSSEEEDRNEKSPFYDILEDSDSNLGNHCRIAENRIYGQIEKLAFENNEWQL